jgi:hypothetical protein
MVGVRAHLEVEYKGGYLLTQTQEVDGGVEKGGLKLFVEVNLATATRSDHAPAMAGLTRAAK